MIQITGLTKVYRRGRPPALLDLTFDARPGVVTALLGAEGAGKTTALRLMVELERGSGITLFDGRTYRRLRRPEREVGVLLPGGRPLAGHPGRRARNHLKMLAGAVGVPSARADELLDQTRLAAVSSHRLRSFSPGMHRRLALAAALLGSPHTLLLDAPTEGLSPRNVEWLHSFLRSFAASGGTVLVTTRTPQEAAVLADRVITLDQGRLLADQQAVEFRRTRLHPEVSVRGPQMARLADLLAGQGAQVRRDGGAGIAVSGIDRTEIGELAYRNGILLHELSDRVVEQLVPHLSLPSASDRSGHVQLRPAARAAARVAAKPAAHRAEQPTGQSAAQPDDAPTPDTLPVDAQATGGELVGPRSTASAQPVIGQPGRPMGSRALGRQSGRAGGQPVDQSAGRSLVSRPTQADRAAAPPSVSVPTPGPEPEPIVLSQPLPGLDHHRSE
ncbi:ATP-binding cassette domain-containing protein [Saccharothrix sp. ST-888]|uniref:ATP-binding cassette domain-containing protein n=1 Tax=Saccharothrix sp. ST-888 TaxID=1427391 RepID=UPI0006976739|nr:ATP-binding cassette domain-containing protein [Saccharothrix sp. ST-888]